MSETYCKHAIRIILNNFKEMSSLEKLNWLEYRFGKCKHANYNENSVDFCIEDFNYSKNLEFLRDEKNNYAIDIIIARDEEYSCDSLNLSMNEIKNKFNEFCRVYKIKDIDFDTDVRIISYMWYTGSDEPCYYNLFS